MNYPGAHIGVVVDSYLERISELEYELAEWKAAAEGTTVSCVCGGQDRVEKLEAKVATLEFALLAEKNKNKKLKGKK